MKSQGPRSSFTYLVEDYLARDFMSLRNQVLGRYPAFFQKPLSSPSKEIRLLASIVSRDPRSTTSKNLLYMKKVSGRDPWDYSSQNLQKLDELNANDQYSTFPKISQIKDVITKDERPKSP